MVGSFVLQSYGYLWLYLSSFRRTPFFCKASMTAAVPSSRTASPAHQEALSTSDAQHRLWPAFHCTSLCPKQPSMQPTMLLRRTTQALTCCSCDASSPWKGPASSVNTPALSTGAVMGRWFRKPTCMACHTAPSRPHTRPGQDASRACFTWHLGGGNQDLSRAVQGTYKKLFLLRSAEQVLRPTVTSYSHQQVACSHCVVN